MIKALLNLFILFLLPAILLSQNAPVTTCATVGGNTGGTVSVPVTVTGFSAIGAISLTIDYDYSVVHFVSGDPHPDLAGFAVGDASLGTGYHRITMGWFGQSTTLPDGAAIMTLNFTYLAGNTALTWFDNGPSCEYADADYNVLNDIPASTYYINGYVCGLIQAPGSITGDNNVCQGEQGVVYSVAPVTNATSYAWTVPPGATIMSGGTTNSILVDYSAGAASGNVTVHGINDCGSGPSSQLAVTVNPLPVADAGADVSIPYGTSTTLHAVSGGSGSYGYHWSPEALLVNPDNQNPQTVNLYSTTIFKLKVTNLSTLCNDSDEVVVTITGGPLSINPVAIPAVICSGQSSQLFANAGGGSGNYTYAWTCDPAGSPPWTSNLENPVVTPPVTTNYFLTVNDGFNSVNGSTHVTVNQLPTATVTGGDSLCEDGSAATVTVTLTGTPPWYFVYTDGLNSYVVQNQMTSPYLIVTSTPGTYSVSYIQDPNCTGIPYGTATVLVFPVPATPVITGNVTYLISDACCGNQWYLDGNPVAGAVNQIYSPVISGAYFDIVTMNGCSSDTSNTIDVIVGMDQESSGKALLYPNPAGKNVRSVSVSAPEKIRRIMVFSMVGVEVMESGDFTSSRQGMKNLDISDIEPGFYLVKIETLDGDSFSLQFIRL